MGDGCVALILDVLGIARRACIVEDCGQPDTALLADAEKNGSDAGGESLLLFSLGSGGQAAIPLSHVARLEEFEPSRVEFSGNSEVVQYRGEIMPLVRVSRILGFPDVEHSADDRVRVVVYSNNGRSFGLVVHRILDTVHETVAIQKSINRPGILGSAVVKKCVTDFIDIEKLIELAAIVQFAGVEG